MNEQGIKKAKETFDQIEELRCDRATLQNQQAKEIGTIDNQLNQLYAKLSAALDMANT